MYFYSVFFYFNSTRYRNNKFPVRGLPTYKLGNLFSVRVWQFRQNAGNASHTWVKGPILSGYFHIENHSYLTIYLLLGCKKKTSTRVVLWFIRLHRRKPPKYNIDISTYLSHSEHVCTSCIWVPITRDREFEMLCADWLTKLYYTVRAIIVHAIFCTQ